MGLFILAGLLVLIVLTALLHPLFREPKSATEAPLESGIYQDQLAEIRRDQDRGVITPDQARAATAEIERRLLVALRREDNPRASTDRSSRFVMMTSVAAVPLVAGAIYLAIGAPELPDQPFHDRGRAIATNTAPGTHSELMTRIGDLEARLAATPDDLEGHALLARSYASIGNYAGALDSYATANRLAEGRDRRLAGEYAEVMVMANDGLVPDSAAAIFDRIAEDFPDDPQATYYRALRAHQQGDSVQALAMLTALRQASPPNAPWLPAIDELIVQIDPGTAPTPMPSAPARGPTAEQMAAAAEMSEDDRAAMIDSMVAGLAARLEEDPENIDGWRRLARAYEVLGRTDDAARAHREVLARDPDDPAAQAFLGE